jgi:hypothetical protein
MILQALLAEFEHEVNSTRKPDQQCYFGNAA